jgi:hypothetical protein
MTSCWAQRLLDEADAEPWEASITRAGRFSWSISPAKGLTGLREDYLAIGSREHAERKARRIIRRLERADQRHADRTIIRGDMP